MTNLSTILSESAREFDEVFPCQKYKDRPDESTAAFIQADADVLKSFLLSKQRAVIEAIIKECQRLISTHPEHEGSYCDTGGDMDWSCRSRCVELALARLSRLKESLE